MRKSKLQLHQFVSALWIVVALFFASCYQDSKSEKPQLFEPDNISTDQVEYATSFSPSGMEVYFARSNGQWGKMNLKSSIYCSVKENNKWSKPQLVSFSGQYDDSAPHITDDGKTMYFISDRPFMGIQQNSQDIWKVQRNENGRWGEPIRLENPINSPENEYGVCTDKAGNLYFASNRKGGYGQGDLYVAKKKNIGFATPFNLGNVINSAKGEWNLEVSEDGNILIFEASQRVQNLSSYGDLYISFKSDGEWSQPQNIEEVNTTGSDLFPELVDNLLFFSSSDSLKSTRTNIYFLNFKALEKKYRMNAVFQ